MATRDEAYAQYKNAYGSHFDADAENDFNNYWNNSTDSGAYQGAGYNKSWDQVLGDVNQRVDQRFNQPANQQPATQYALPQGNQGIGAAAPSNPQLQQAQTANATRNTDMWNRLWAQAQQGLNVDPQTNPVIRAQADAYSANEQRAGRNYIADLAEKAGPYANLRGEQRMVSERIGQRTGANEAGLVADEIKAKRDEIAQALAMLSGQLSGDETRALQEQLALYDNAIREKQVGLQQQGLDQDWQRTLLGNELSWADLGLNAEDRASYWDAVRSGLL